MKFRVSGNIGYEVRESSTLILNIHALRSAAQSVLEESFSIEPYYKFEELTTAQTENRYVRLEIPEPANISIS